MPHFTITPYYITIIDAEGGINMADNSFVPISHRVYVDKTTIYGIESLRKVFNYDTNALHRFIMRTLEESSGSEGRLTWERK